MPKIQNPSPGTRGEPDRVRVSDGGKEPLFRDDLAVSPTGRGNLCCDAAALKKRIGNPPEGGDGRRADDGAALPQAAGTGRFRREDRRPGCRAGGNARENIVPSTASTAHENIENRANS